jgi:hypothetical protein
MNIEQALIKKIGLSEEGFTLQGAGTTVALDLRLFRDEISDIVN